jgi:tetratricopeptide (TPR) repeat protein
MERLAADFPDVPELPSELAGFQINLGAALRKLGDLPEAERLYRKAVRTLGSLAARFPRVPEHRVRLGAAQFNLANLLGAVDRLPEAERVSREALQMHEELAQEFRGVPAYRASLAEAWYRLGNTLKREGKYPAADEAYSRSLGMREKLLETEPGNPAYRAAVAWSCQSLASQLAYEQDPPYRAANRALELAKRAVDLDPQGARWQVLGWALVRAGHWREGLAAIEHARQLNAGYGADHFFEAIARRQSGEPGAALENYHAGVAWLEKQASPPERALQLRAEAAKVLGITESAGREQAAPRRAAPR